LDIVTTQSSAQRCAALIPAAGSGTRLGLGPKALLRLGERTLLEMLLQKLRPVVDRILVAAPPDRRQQVESLCDGQATVVDGGQSRSDSIARLLAACDEELLLIQDVARPFASRELCQRVIDAAARHGAAGAFLDPTVPVGALVENRVATYWERTGARLFQAPQAFSREVLDQAQRALGGREFQSTAQMVMSSGIALAVVEGEETNIKITSPFDWRVAQQVIAPMLREDGEI
jgi:2-C-methyl-D-erythritol 4-phosphate cytidylyltransferase